MIYRKLNRHIDGRKFPYSDFWDPNHSKSTGSLLSFHFRIFSSLSKDSPIHFEHIGLYIGFSSSRWYWKLQNDTPYFATALSPQRTLWYRGFFSFSHSKTSCLSDFAISQDQIIRSVQLVSIKYLPDSVVANSIGISFLPRKALRNNREQLWNYDCWYNLWSLFHIGSFGFLLSGCVALRGSSGENWW